MSVQGPEDQGPPSRQFKGVWIAAGVWDNPELSLAEKFLVAEVDSLCGKDKACFASNEYLAKRLRVTPKYMNNMLARLTADGYLVRLFFNGRTTLRCVCPNLSSDPDTAQKLLEKYEANTGESSLHKNVKAQESRERRVHKKLNAGFTNRGQDLAQGSQKAEPEISSKKDTKRDTTKKAAALTKSITAPESPVVVVSFLGSGEEKTEAPAEGTPAVVAALSEEFGLTPKQSRTVQAYAVRNGLERVQEVADIVRSKPRENLGQSFMAGIRDGWKKPQSTVEKRATRKESAEPREWKRALHELYPNTGLGLYEVWANVPASLQQEVREHLAAAPRGT